MTQAWIYEVEVVLNDMGFGNGKRSLFITITISVDNLDSER